MGSIWARSVEANLRLAATAGTIRLRLRALEGATLQPEEIYTALMHLTKRRGYLSKVPWASFREELEDKEAQKEAGEMMKPCKETRWSSNPCNTPVNCLLH